MSQKKHKKLRRLGVDRKTQNQFMETDLVLLDRQSLMCILELFHLKFVRHEDEGWEETVRDSMVNFSPRLESDKEKFYRKIINFEPCYHVRTEYPAIPISVFHREKSEEVLFAFTSCKEFYQLTSGLQIRSSEDSDPVMISPRPSKFAGITPFNSFQLELDLGLLNEVLPSSRPDLDQLIVLGQLDEKFSPLTEEELIPFMQLKVNEPEVWKRMYTDQLMVIETSHGTFYQPQKTRIAWSQNVHSVPLKMGVRNGRSGCMVPTYKSRPLYHTFK